MNRYTGFIQFGKDPSNIEEIDVDAEGRGTARKLIEAEIQSGYEYKQGYKILEIRERIGWYM